MDKLNLYWPVYKNLEKEVLNLSYHIHFCDTQQGVFSIFTAELLIRCSVEIESISKALYQREGGNMKPTDESGNIRYLNYDFDCLKMLDLNWKLGKKQVILVAPSMYFEKEENRIFTPLKNAHRGEAAWQRAYQAVKHSRVDNLNRAGLRVLVCAMASLYLLNIYYRDDVFEVGTTSEAVKSFDTSLQSDLFSVKYKTFNSFPYHGDELDNIPDITYVSVFKQESYDEISEEYQNMRKDIIENSLKKITLNPERYANLTSPSDLWEIAVGEKYNTSKDVMPLVGAFANRLREAKHNVVLNKCQKLR